MPCFPARTMALPRNWDLKLSSVAAARCARSGAIRWGWGARSGWPGGAKQLKRHPDYPRLWNPTDRKRVRIRSYSTSTRRDRESVRQNSRARKSWTTPLNGGMTFQATERSADQSVKNNHSNTL